MKSEFLDVLMREAKLRSDSEVARFLGVSFATVCRIRSRTYRITGDLVLRIYDKTGWSIEQIRALLGLPQREVTPKEETDDDDTRTLPG